MAEHKCLHSTILWNWHFRNKTIKQSLLIPFCSPVAELSQWLGTQKLSGLDRSAQTRQVDSKSPRIHLHTPPNPTCSRWYDHDWLKADYKPDSTHPPLLKHCMVVIHVVSVCVCLWYIPGWLHPTAYSLSFRPDQHDSLPAGARSIRQLHHKGTSCWFYNTVVVVMIISICRAQMICVLHGRSLRGAWVHIVEASDRHLLTKNQ